MKLVPGERFPDLDLPDHTGRDRLLSEAAGGDPVALVFSRGWFCPKEQRYLRELTRLQDECEVAYTRIVVVSVDPPAEQSALRAGLGARFLFLSDAERRWLPRLGLLEETDTLHEPYRPTAFTLLPDLEIHRRYDGDWYWGRPTMEDLRQDMRAISALVRPGFERL
ncbi:MAG: redoxin domain-containing protein [Thermoleophilaceae bacterium]